MKRIVKRLLIPITYNSKIIEKSGDGRFYKDSILLNAGEYSDSITRSPVMYSEDELKKTADKWIKKNQIYDLDDDKIYLDLDHRIDESLKRIGYVTNIHFSNNAIKGDLYFHRLTQNSKDTVILIDAGFLNNLSVEISTEDTWNSEDNKRYAENIELIGLAVVTMGACPSAKVIPDK